MRTLFFTIMALIVLASVPVLLVHNFAPVLNLKPTAKRNAQRFEAAKSTKAAGLEAIAAERVALKEALDAGEMSEIAYIEAIMATARRKGELLK